MSEHDDEFEDESENPNLKQLREKAKAADSLKDQLDSAARELAFYRAGVGDLNEKQQKAVLANLDGEVNPETVKAVAGELGFVTVDPPVDTTSSTDAATQRMDEIATGGGLPGSRDFTAEIQAAKTEEEVIRLYQEAGGSLYVQ